MFIRSLEFNGIHFTECSPKRLLSAGVPQSVIDNAVSEQETFDVNEKRRVAYVAESDPLYMEWQYDNTPESEQAWRDKVAEIKARYPLPSES